jgi:hypothetical protein
MSIIEQGNPNLKPPIVYGRYLMLTATFLDKVNFNVYVKHEAGARSSVVG